MRSQYKHARVARGAIGLGVVLAVSSAVGGCVYVDESGQLAGPEQFCGYLYACGSDSDTNQLQQHRRRKHDRRRIGSGSRD